LSVYFLEEDNSKKYAGVELELHAFLTAIQGTGECSMSYLSRYIYIWVKSFILDETSWAHEPVWPVLRRDETLPPPGIDLRFFRLVACSLVYVYTQNLSITMKKAAFSEFRE